MLTRRSVSHFDGDGPSADEVAAVVRAALTVPDHGAVRPWRLVLVTGDEFPGWVNLGRLSADRVPAARPEVDLAEIVRVRSADGRPERYGPPVAGGAR
jgi:nitroreductase